MNSHQQHTQCNPQVGSGRVEWMQNPCPYLVEVERLFLKDPRLKCFPINLAKLNEPFLLFSENQMSPPLLLKVKGECSVDLVQADRFLLFPCQIFVKFIYRLNPDPSGFYLGWFQLHNFSASAQDFRILYVPFQCLF